MNHKKRSKRRKNHGTRTREVRLLIMRKRRVLK
jgi:hypothetical protein